MELGYKSYIDLPQLAGFIGFLYQHHLFNVYETGRLQKSCFVCKEQAHIQCSELKKTNRTVPVNETKPAIIAGFVFLWKTVLP